MSDPVKEQRQSSFLLSIPASRVNHQTLDIVSCGPVEATQNSYDQARRTLAREVAKSGIFALKKVVRS
jgi:hypothetical protein